MQTEYVYLKIVNYEKFLEKAKELTNYPEIAMHQQRAYGMHSQLHYFIRLSKQIPAEHLILVCDVPIYDGATFDKKPDELTQMKNEILAKIETKAKEVYPDLKIVDGEYLLEMEFY